MIQAAIVGASGYVGGELLRLLLAHPQVEVTQITLERYAKQYAHFVHPNLRGHTSLRFNRLADLQACDLLFLALPHGHAMERIDEFAGMAERIVDLSADFCLRDPADYVNWYQHEHPGPDWLARSYMPIRHRHLAELIQELSLDPGQPGLHYSITLVGIVRGALATCHCLLHDEVDEREVWQYYRQDYKDEPFVRLVRARRGIHRYPEPKILTASNYCDVGFVADPGQKRLVVIAAIDNLMKGAAGSAVQSMNVMYGFPERTGLEFPGLHPV